MKTYQLAVYLLAAIVLVALLFGFLPPLLNAHDTALNALGAGLVVACLLCGVLVAHAAHVRSLKLQPPPREKE